MREPALAVHTAVGQRRKRECGAIDAFTSIDDMDEGAVGGPTVIVKTS
jgi:hypothetical protein